MWCRPMRSTTPRTGRRAGCVPGRPHRSTAGPRHRSAPPRRSVPGAKGAKPYRGPWSRPPRPLHSAPLDHVHRLGSGAQAPMPLHPCGRPRRPPTATIVPGLVGVFCDQVPNQRHRGRELVGLPVRSQRLVVEFEPGRPSWVDAKVQRAPPGLGRTWRTDAGNAPSARASNCSRTSVNDFGPTTVSVEGQFGPWTIVSMLCAQRQVTRVRSRWPFPGTALAPFLGRRRSVGREWARAHLGRPATSLQTYGYLGSTQRLDDEPDRLHTEPEERGRRLNDRVCRSWAAPRPYRKVETRLPTGSHGTRATGCTVAPVTSRMHQPDQSPDRVAARA